VLGPDSLWWHNSVVVEVWLITLIGIVLVHVTIMFIVHSLNLTLAMLSGPDLVIFIESLRLSELVNFTSNEAGEDFFGEAVVDGLALSALLVLVELHALEGRGTANELVREFALMVIVAVVHLLMGVTVFVEPTHVELVEDDVRLFEWYELFGKVR